MLVSSDHSLWVGSFGGEGGEGVDGLLSVDGGQEEEDEKKCHVLLRKIVAKR